MGEEKTPWEGTGFKEELSALIRTRPRKRKGPLSRETSRTEVGNSKRGKNIGRGQDIQPRDWQAARGSLEGTHRRRGKVPIRPGTYVRGHLKGDKGNTGKTEEPSFIRWILT